MQGIRHRHFQYSISLLSSEEDEIPQCLWLLQEKILMDKEAMR
jgi:hypothetical protein